MTTLIYWKYCTVNNNTPRHILPILVDSFLNTEISRKRNIASDVFEAKREQFGADSRSID